MSYWTVKTVKYKVFHWDRKCPYCDVTLLQLERGGFCCGTKGKYAHSTPPLRPLPTEFDAFLDAPDISSLSRQLNLAFSFSSMETTASFPTADGGMLAIQGRVYHRICPSHGNSPIRWMLIDGMHPDSVPHAQQTERVPAPWLDALSLALRTHNPLTRDLMAIHNQAIQPTILHIQLRDHGAAPEVAALISLDNTSISDLCLRSALTVWLDGTTKQIPITSPLWEPLAYPLLFPFSEPGWGLYSQEHDVNDRVRGSDTVPDHETPGTQIWWY
jgi:hypothetical protein